MSQGIASRYVGKEITICQNCFHGNVCGNRDYLTENECCNFVSEAPTIDKVAVRCGHWTLFDEDSNVWSCSVCDEPYIICNDDTPRENNYNYCPNCGAKMGAVEGWTVNEIEKAIQEFIDNAFHESLKPDISIKSKALAIVALHEKLERERPEPISLEQLRQMDGNPVWVECTEEYNSVKKWDIVCFNQHDGIINKYFPFRHAPLSMLEYGETWLAYTHKPEQEKKT